ncbi:hypothetical protein OL239_01915 [Arthrobacter sp. ATA002]|uniref:hypothetical protein n=1 Tax=Arthrobacter sp. ATA002 TaxID=2991715 RepID=UPI0022A67775|nr:hypothetical protein [Arthrobacter sp. ATA002]WAP52102.1 hypothetical protein OL239_01915 [Arthrobacter sp. ATA002]
MGSWQSGFSHWVPAWAAVRGLSSIRDGDAVKMAPARTTDPPQYVVTWPGRDTPRAAAEVSGRRGSRLTLVTDDAETAQEFAAGQGLAPLSRLALLTAYPSDLPQVPQLPDGAELSAAAAGGGTVVGITAFGETVAGARMAAAPGFAVFGGLDIRRADPDHTMESAVITALAGEAAATEVPLILMPALPKSVPWYSRQGWSATADVLTFMRAADA